MARTFTNIATQDTEGVNLPGDFKVTALGTPARAVQIAPGGITIRNRQRPGESYIGAALSTTQVSIPANSSGAVRRDLVIARIIDPEFSPWQPYTDPTAILSGPYFEPYVVSGVGANVATLPAAGVNYSGFPLARIDQPSGAPSITSGMITDLRALARPRFWFEHDVQKGTQSSAEYLTTAETAWHHWPLNTFTVNVPSWATTAQVSVALNNVLVERRAANFSCRIAFGSLTPQVGTPFNYNGSDWSPLGYVETVPHTIYGEFDVTSLQGQTGVLIRPEVQRTFTANSGDIWFNNSQQVIFDVRFREKAI